MNLVWGALLVAAQILSPAPTSPEVRGRLVHYFADARRVLEGFWDRPVSVPDVYVCRTTRDFCARTRAPWWRGACLKHGVVYLQPLELLEARAGALKLIIHEFAHAELKDAGLPLWFEEGLAVFLSGEGKQLDPNSPASEIDARRIDELLSSERREDVREGYAAAYRRTTLLVRRFGRTVLANMIERRQGWLLAEP